MKQINLQAPGHVTNVQGGSGQQQSQYTVQASVRGVKLLYPSNEREFEVKKLSFIFFSLIEGLLYFFIINTIIV